VIGVVMLGGYALFAHLSKASAVAPPRQAAPVVQPAPRDALARAELDHERIAPAVAVAAVPVILPPVEAAPVAAAPSGEAIPDPAPPAPPAVSPPRDAKFYREEGRRAYQAGDFDLAIADFDLAIELDPDVEAAYIDRSIVLYRVGDPHRVGTQRRALSSSR
jgi:tetratricopeptide (TPR) repeat protein